MKPIKTLVREIIATEYELQQYTDDDPQQPVAAAPASAADLARLQAHLAQLGLPLPPGYRQFLAVCDGIEGFMTHFSLLGVAGVLKGASARRRRSYPDYADFLIGQGESLEFLAFDRRARQGDELELVFVTDEGEESRYAGMQQFLSEHLAALAEDLAGERADRQNLKD